MTNRLPLLVERPVRLERPQKDDESPPGRRPTKASALLALLGALVAALVLVPMGFADDDDDDDGGGGGATVQSLVLASADTDTEYSLDGGTTWHPAVIVTQPNQFWQDPVSAWIAPTETGESGNALLIRYRRFFTIPAGCTGTSLTVQVNADDDATVTLNDVPFGQTVPFFAWLEPTETFATVGPFVPGQNRLGFEVRNFGDPTALDYRAEVTMTCVAGDGDDDDDDDGEDDEDEDDDEDDDD
jgi:hypothetical protein